MFAQRLAREKAQTVWSACKTEALRHSPAVRANAHPQEIRNTVVLGADTIVVVEGEVLGKPVDAADAGRMLRRLSGRTHQVTTGVCLIGEDFEDVRCATTDVTFDRLTDSDISEYIAHGEPMDKAGAYAIQGIASRWICRLDGCYFNVVGLPVPLVYRMLRERGAI
jgi:septum formation protein